MFEQILDHLGSKDYLFGNFEFGGKFASQPEVQRKSKTFLS